MTDEVVSKLTSLIPTIVATKMTLDLMDKTLGSNPKIKNMKLW